MELKTGSRKIKIQKVRKVSEWGKIRGLMFRKKENAKALIFEFKSPTGMSIHSCFVFFDFLALWLDEDNNILEKKIVEPWRFSVSPSVKYYKLLEIPLNNLYYSKVKKILSYFPSDKRFK